MFLSVQSPAAPLLASADVPPLRAVRLKPREPNVDVDRRAELERRKSVLHAAHMQELQRARKEGERGEAQANHDRAVKERAAMKKRAVAAKARGVRAAALASPSFLSLSVSLSLVKRLTAISIFLIYIYVSHCTCRTKMRELRERRGTLVKMAHAGQPPLPDGMPPVTAHPLSPPAPKWAEETSPSADWRRPRFKTQFRRKE